MDSQESSPIKSINSSVLRFLYGPTLTSIHDYWKKTALTRWTFVGKTMSLLFNMLSRLVIPYLQRSKHGLINFMAAITIWSDFGAQENSLSLFPLFPHLFAMKWWDQMPWLSSFTFIKRLFSSSLLYAIRVILQQLCQIKSLESISHFHCIIVRDLI